MVCKTRFTSSQPQKIQQFVVRDLRWPAPPTTAGASSHPSATFPPSWAAAQVLARRAEILALTIRLWRNSIWKKYLIYEFLRNSSYSKVRRLPRIPESSKKGKYCTLQEVMIQFGSTFCSPSSKLLVSNLVLGAPSPVKVWGFPGPHLKRCRCTTSSIHRKPCWKMFGKSHLASHDIHDFRDFLILDWSRYLVSLSSISLSNRWFASSS